MIHKKNPKIKNFCFKSILKKTIKVMIKAKEITKPSCLIHINKLQINKIVSIFKLNDLVLLFESRYIKCIAVVTSEKINISWCPENMLQSE